MGSVCSSGIAEKKKSVEVGGKTLRSVWKLKKKKKSFVNRKGDSHPNSRTINGVKKQKKKESGLSSELKLLTPSATGGKQVRLLIC